MTIAELIAELQKYPPDMQVLVSYDTSLRELETDKLYLVKNALILDSYFDGPYEPEDEVITGSGGSLYILEP